MDEPSLEDMSEDLEINKNEITRNPFDSQLCSRENYPGLDSSVFSVTETPEEEKGEFRWSIGQIAIMNPAELDLYPNQEYSVSYLREEDEIRDQEKVNEYFQNVLLPSPWLQENGESIKRVTFSPHPPSMRFINNDINDSTDYLENSVSTESKDKTSNESYSNKVDACCQTRITVPFEFDLEALLEKHLPSYSDISAEGRELMVSTLRRKLFGQEINEISPGLDFSNNCITSSPRKCGFTVHNSSNLQNSKLISPVKGCNNTLLNKNSASSFTNSSNIQENLDMSFSSDISDIEFNDRKCIDSENFHSMLMDLNDGTGLKESTNVLPFGSLDVSPIRFADKKKRCQLSDDAATDSMEIRHGNIPSVQESTAKNAHVFSGIDLSSIQENSKRKDSNTKDISENNLPTDSSIFKSKFHHLFSTPLHDLSDIENSEKAEKSQSFEESSGDSISPCVRSIISNDLSPITPVRSIRTKPETVRLKEDDHIHVGATSSLIQDTSRAPLSDPNSPLKGILKKSDSVTPTRTIAERSTHYNTICNSGQKRPVPILGGPAIIYKGRYVSKFNRSLNNEFDLSLEACVECKNFQRCEHHMSDNGCKTPSEKTPFSRVLNVNSHLNENSDKENVEFCTTNGDTSSLDRNVVVSKSEETSRCDSEPESMILCSKQQGDKQPFMNQYGITPLSRLTNELQINDPRTCSKKYSSPMTNQSLNRSRSFIGTPKNYYSNSRLFSRKSRSEIAVIKRLHSSYQYGRRNVLSAYKDLLPSPLK